MGFGEQPVGYQQSDFNSGLSIIYQIDHAERLLMSATVERNYDKHYRLLLCYFKILFPVMDEKEKDLHLQMWAQVKHNFNQYKNARIKGKRSVPANLLDSFDFWELKMRELKQKRGLGMPKKKDARYALSGG